MPLMGGGKDKVREEGWHSDFMGPLQIQGGTYSTVSKMRVPQKELAPEGGGFQLSSRKYLPGEVLR